MSSLTLADLAQEIDSYMAEQGEETVPPFPPAVPPQEHSSLQNMAPTDKVAFVEKGKAGEMEAGETWHLVSKRWFKRWNSACTGEAGKDEAVSEQDLGPVDNSPLLDDAGDLKKGLIEGIDVEYVPEDVWTALTTWFVPLALRQVLPAYWRVGMANPSIRSRDALRQGESMRKHRPWNSILRRSRSFALPQTHLPTCRSDPLTQRFLFQSEIQSRVYAPRWLKL
jgi:hypothetical protein